MSDERETYGFTWPGKREAVLEAGRMTDKVLRPVLADSVDFSGTGNIYIEGDNLEALKIIQRSYMRKVKMIYIDPPYNTGNEFIYRDDFAQSERDSQAQLGFEDEQGRNYSSEVYRENKKSNPRFHSDWCSMMYPRLKIAQNLLRDDGVIFVSIDDNEQSRLRMMCDEIFGENNFVACISWKGRGGRQDSKYLAVIHEYILCYAKDIDDFQAGEREKEGDKYPKYDTERKQRYKTQLLRKWGSGSKREDRPNLYYPITAPDGSEVYPMITESQCGRWRWGQDTMQEAIEAGRVEFVKGKNGTWTAYEKIYEGDVTTKKYDTWIDDIPNGTETLKGLFGTAPFDYSKSPELIARLMHIANLAPDSIVLDFFAGSSTTAHAVMSLTAQDSGNRKFILIQLPEPCGEKSEARKAGYHTICDIGRERIVRSGKWLANSGKRIVNSA
ncbi:MAG: site-specific DNA-methyltransferase, partial [Synergistaceae bacterium]|nr:site-specific DNA-methyltransferase [Synergistaceae bacterium]